MLGVYSPESIAIRRAHRIALVCREKMNDQAFFEARGQLDDWYGKFQVRAFHIWLVHNRLRSVESDKEFAKLVQQHMFESFWEHTIRDIGNSEQVPQICTFKYLRELQSRFFGGSVSYDQIVAIGVQDPQFPGMFASVLHRNFYSLSDTVSARELEKMVTYARDSILALHNLDDDVILDGEIPIWPKPSVFEGPTDKGTIQGSAEMRA